eukprot:19885_1
MELLSRNRKAIFDANTSNTITNVKEMDKMDKKHHKLNRWIHFNSKIIVYCVYAYERFKSKLSCCKITLIFTICILIIIFLYYGHYITCYITIQLCTPFHFYLRMLHSHILQNDVMDYTSFQNNIESMYYDKNNNVNICVNKLVKNPCREHLKLGIIFGQRHGGSTWTVQQLNKNPFIIGYREKLEIWENNNCVLFAKIEHAVLNGLTFNFNTENEKDCNSNTLIVALKDIYNGFFDMIM